MKTGLTLLMALTLSGCLAPNEGSSGEVETEVQAPSSDLGIEVQYPEVYELANIILALTDYGQTDPWQVQKEFSYYREMLQHFEAFQDHPLLAKVNFSRERWEEFLSFRTDAFAFAFDENGRLARQNDFQAFEIMAFDEHLELVQDFADKTNFRSFFEAHQSYYGDLLSIYKQEYRIEEMQSFLREEFGLLGEQNYLIVVSSLVGGQNLHRDFEWTVVDFPALPKPILEGVGGVDRRELSRDTHILFTEMDHGYVNPLTAEHRVSVAQNFDEGVWSEDSGYENQDNGVFNEYMTWAVYDIFNQKLFPEYSSEFNLYWHFQNETRGFVYSHLFAKKLNELYANRRAGERIRDLYPGLLAWTREIQATLTKPTLEGQEKPIFLRFAEDSRIQIRFSESMTKSMEFTALLQGQDGYQETVSISKDDGIEWSEDGFEVSFGLDLPDDRPRLFLVFNWWGTPKPLMSSQGVLLKSGMPLELIHKE